MMKPVIYSVLILACIALLFTMGCTGQQQSNPTVTPTATTPGPTQVPATISAKETRVTSAPVTGAVPADTLPAEVSQPPDRYAIDVKIDKDRVYSTITVTFIGGPGQVLVNNILVRVNRSDGVKEEKEIPFTGQIPTGASVNLPGTKGSDQVEVYATINGVVYKLKDQNMVYEQY
jgi:hypothetical protein